MTTPRDDLRERLEAEAIALSVRRFTDLDDTDADALAALLREAAARLGEREWMPIESAPKEHGMEILACERGRTMAVIEWLDKENIMYGDEDDFVSGWYISDGHNDPIWYRNWPSLTHFMPLPSPPETTNDR